MKKSIYILLFFSSFFCFSQEVKDEFLGEIHSVSEVFYDDEAAFINNANRYKHISDSIAKQDYLKNPKSANNSKHPSLEARLNYNRFTDAIALRFGIENSGRPKIKRWMFSQSFVKMYTSEQNTLLLNRRTAKYYNHYEMNRTTNKQELAYYTFFNGEPESIVIDKEDIKKIAGVTCYKATVSFRNSVFASINKSNHRIIYEMYVTDSIKSKYSPFTHNLAILNKFYPMYIKKYDTGLIGRYYEDKIVKVASLRETSLKELQEDYKHLKDSILAKYPPLLTIEDMLNGTTKNKNVPLEKQLKVLESLSYKLNPKITLQEFEQQLIRSGVVDTTETSMKECFERKPYRELYFSMGRWVADKEKKENMYFCKSIIYHNLEYFEIDEEYIRFMKRMGAITDGELVFKNIKMTVDEDNYQWIVFSVNGFDRKWKLEKINRIDSSFVSRFSLLTYEFNTKGKYTYFDLGGKSYVLDYATPEEQKEFIEKTGIKREWLKIGKHFPIPKKHKRKPVPFKEQLEVLESLGYKFNPKTTLKEFERELILNGVVDTTQTTMEAYFTQRPYGELYFFMGWWIPDMEKKENRYFCENILYHDLDYFENDLAYIYLMKRMGAITNGELVFKDIEVTTDTDNYKWIAFTINDIDKKWKLAKVNFRPDSYISRFVDLTKEFNTKGRFTYFDLGGESYLLDYATPEEQKEFVTKTDLQREWLTAGKHFPKPKD